MMTISDLWKSSDPCSCSGIQTFRGPCCCRLSFCNDSRPLRRWLSHERLRKVIPKLCSREDAVRPYLPRHMRSIRGCHGDGSDPKDARLGSQEPRVDTLGFGDGLYSYKIREGDTLTSIANKFRVRLRSIANLNEIADIDYVPAGKLLLIPHDRIKTGEVGPDVGHHSLNLVEAPADENRSNTQVKGSFSLAPACSSIPLFQAQHVKLALSFLLLLAIFGFVRKYISGLGPKRHDDRVECQIEREVPGTHQKTSVRRWQGILDGDQRANEEDSDLFADGRAALDTEEENLHQSYAQLESAYVKFLVDSGLSKTGYWRGGVPPALEEK